MTINGLILPIRLIRAIECGYWSMPADKNLLSKAFPHERIVDPKLYSIESMKLENAGWPGETLLSYLGEKDDSGIGDIDPSQSVIIGDLGPDQLIVLDYRMSKDEPSVAYLTDRNRWISIAPDVGTFLTILGHAGAIV